MRITLRSFGVNVYNTIMATLSENYTPIQSKKSHRLTKILTYDLTKNKYFLPVLIVSLLIFGTLYMVNYFSPREQCIRRVKKNIKAARQLTGISNPYVAESLLREETKKCFQ